MKKKIIAASIISLLLACVSFCYKEGFISSIYYPLKSRVLGRTVKVYNVNDSFFWEILPRHSDSLILRQGGINYWTGYCVTIETYRNPILLERRIKWTREIGNRYPDFFKTDLDTNIFLIGNNKLGTLSFNFYKDSVFIEFEKFRAHGKYLDTEVFLSYAYRFIAPLQCPVRCPF